MNSSVYSYAHTLPLKIPTEPAGAHSNTCSGCEAKGSYSQTIQIEVPTAVVTRKGGTIAPEDQQAELYLPPNTLAQDTIVTVNALTETEVEPPVRRVSQIYDFAPATLRLNSIKPATLTISYDASQLSTGKEPVICHRTDGLWKAVGGTPNPEQQTISPRVYCP